MCVHSRRGLRYSEPIYNLREDTRVVIFSFFFSVSDDMYRALMRKKLK